MTGRSPEAKKRRAEKRKAQLEEKWRRLVADAQSRRPVRLPDGGTGRLLKVPAHSAHISSGAKARVLLPSGAVLSVPMSDITVLYWCKVEGCTREGIMVAGFCEPHYQAQWKQKQASA